MQKSKELVSSDMNNVIANHNVINLWRNFPRQIRDDACFSAIRSQVIGESRKFAGKIEFFCFNRKIIRVIVILNCFQFAIFKTNTIRIRSM